MIKKIRRKNKQINTRETRARGGWALVFRLFILFWPFMLPLVMLVTLFCNAQAREFSLIAHRPTCGWPPSSTVARLPRLAVGTAPPQIDYTAALMVKSLLLLDHLFVCVLSLRERIYNGVTAYYCFLYTRVLSQLELLLYFFFHTSRTTLKNGLHGRAVTDREPWVFTRGTYLTIYYEQTR